MGLMAQQEEQAELSNVACVVHQQEAGPVTSSAHMLHFDVTEQEMENRVRRVSGEEEEEEEEGLRAADVNVKRFAKMRGADRGRHACSAVCLPALSLPC